MSGTYGGPPASPAVDVLLADEQLSAVQQAKASILVDTAVEDYLASVGGNYGIPPPRSAPADDDVYRLIIQALAMQPKTRLATLYYLLEAVFGSQGDLVTQGLRPWRVYEVNPDEVILEIPFYLTDVAAEAETFLHGVSGVVLSGSTTSTFSTPGDVTGGASTLVGLQVSAQMTDGSWQAKTIATAVYSGGNTNFSVTAPFTNAPASGSYFSVDVPGDGTSSWRGDYVAPLWLASGTSSATAPGSLTDGAAAYVVNAFRGKWLVDAAGAPWSITSNTSTVFALNTSGATPASGAYHVQAAPDGGEAADQTDTPAHADRVYLGGDGRLEIVKEYLSFVRAMGVVFRIEKI